MIEITSADNRNIRHIKALARKKEREQSGEYTVEGIKSVNEAVLSGKTVECIVVSRGFDAERLKQSDITTYCVPDFVFERLCDTKNPQGVMAVLKQDAEGRAELAEGGLYLYCDGVADPGNMGTLIRTADAAGFDGVLCSEECVELYNPKCVRASMGSFFRMKLYAGIGADRMAELKKRGVKIFGGALCANTIDYRSADYDGTAVIVVGNEAGGISGEILDLCTPVKIPIYGGAESLNAAVAGGILMYEASNWRRLHKK